MNDTKKDFCMCGSDEGCCCLDTSFLDPIKLKEHEEKIKSGEIVCNIDNPEGCESCSG